MIAIRGSWTAALVGLAAVASLGLRSDDLSGSEAARRAATTGCRGHYSTRCTIEVRYVYPTADASVVPQDVYF